MSLEKGEEGFDLTWIFQCKIYSACLTREKFKKGEFLTRAFDMQSDLLKLHLAMTSII